MRLLKGWLVVPVLFVLLAALALPAAARPQASTSTTTADIQRLQDQIYDIGGDLSRLRSRDASTADRLQGQLDTLREEVIYLKVKLRKDGTVSRSEYTDVRDRLDDLRAQARGEARSGSTTTPSTSGGVYRPSDRGTGAPTTQGTSARDNEIPVGTELDVRLQTPLNSDTAQVEDRFEATTMVELANGPKVIIPAGSVVRGVVTSVDKAGRLSRRGRLTLAFDQVTIGGRSYPLHATVTQALESEGIRGEAGRIGAGAGVGAIIGGILGGLKGALAGILIGGGGTVAATEGKDVELPPGTVLRIRLDSPLVVR